MGEKLNPHKICFITAVNDSEKYNKSLAHNRRLRVPAGMEVESRVITEARSMTEAYQAGMESSDAKYKVYLHQDVLLWDEHFLELMVREFREHPDYGMAGVVGGKNIAPDGVWWHGAMIGSVVDDNDGTMKKYIHECDDKNSMEAAALDGLLLMTQYDIPWRTDLFDKWHFYDLSQCMEFRKRGYKTVVLPGGTPTVMHLCGRVSLDGYDGERLKFIREYGHILNAINRGQV